MEPTGVYHGRSITDSYMTTAMCNMHHQIMEGKLQLLREKDRALEEKIGGVENRLENIEKKIDGLLQLQQKLNDYLLYLAVGTALTFLGVILGRALDFGWIL